MFINIQQNFKSSELSCQPFVHCPSTNQPNAAMVWVISRADDSSFTMKRSFYMAFRVSAHCPTHALSCILEQWFAHRT